MDDSQWSIGLATAKTRKAPKDHVVIATRGSKLALWQADYVTGLLKARGVESEKLIIKTTADRIQDRFLHEIGGKGLFVKELETALVEGKADLAVHSLKDMTATLQAPFALAAVLKRHSACDTMIFRPDVAARLGELPVVIGEEHVRRLGAATIGTGSLRRQAILKKAAPEAKLVGIRGNVDTRIKKLHDGEWDVIVLAEASIERLGITGITHRRLDPEWFVPSSSQGALALETSEDNPMTGWLGVLACRTTTLCVNIERAILARLGGDCNMPVGVHVAPILMQPGIFRGIAAVYDKAGVAARAVHEGPAEIRGGEVFLDALTAKLAQAGAGRVLKDLGLDVPAAFQ